MKQFAWSQRTSTSHVHFYGKRNEWKILKHTTAWCVHIPFERRSVWNFISSSGITMKCLYSLAWLATETVSHWCLFICFSKFLCINKQNQYGQLRTQYQIVICHRANDSKKKIWCGIERSGSLDRMMIFCSTNGGMTRWKARTAHARQFVIRW